MRLFIGILTTKSRLMGPALRLKDVVRIAATRSVQYQDQEAAAERDRAAVEAAKQQERITRLAVEMRLQLEAAKPQELSLLADHGGVSGTGSPPAIVASASAPRDSWSQ
jgi:hypothetical protein